MSGLKKVGKYKSKYNNLLNVNLPVSDIYASEGLNKHILRRHPNCQKYIEKIPEIINNPDYIGKNPKELDSIELVKVFDDNIQIGIKLDTNKNYLYVATLFDIKESKVQRRLNSGRLKALK